MNRHAVPDIWGHEWPDALTPGVRCTRCGLQYKDFDSLTTCGGGDDV